MTSTKERILGWKKEIDHIKQTEYKAVLAREAEIARQVTGLFKRMQNKDYRDQDEYNAIGNQIDVLNEQSKNLKAEYLKTMQERFQKLYTKYPAIFDILVNSEVDQATLTHVLDTYDRVERGQMNTDQGLDHGMNYLTGKYNLPEDFFNRPKKK